MSRSDLPDGWPEMAPSYPSVTAAQAAWTAAIDAAERQVARQYGLTPATLDAMAACGTDHGLVGEAAGSGGRRRHPVDPPGYRKLYRLGLVGDPVLIRSWLWGYKEAPWTERGREVWTALNAAWAAVPALHKYVARVRAEVSDGE